MKYLLIPLTIFLWYLTAYLGIYFGVVLMTWMFSLSWIWLLLGYTFLIGLIFGLTNGIPSLLRYLILKLYGLNWFTAVVHSIAGLLGIIAVFAFFYSNPPEMVSGNMSVPILSAMWNSAPIKTIFLFIPFIGLILSLIYSTSIAPIIMKLEIEEL
ncbi:hypothetical protein DHD32_10100 [Arenibacter sp. TNZ]|uniref:hypothetical protein n=1 Tax=Arenibacter TaxID=178469 RepID=UPI000CD3C639|nr:MULTISPECIES: hypothetical protein [Arenibacter]MCM4171834.1 hypothetical protein [Arenibacter sp. TNZ]